MRESIGTAWIMGIVITFITLFSGYLAFSVNYSKAFSLKDEIIDKIQKHSGFTSTTQRDITDYMESISYASVGRCKKSNEYDYDSKLTGVLGNSRPDNNPMEKDTFNYCIERHKSKNYTEGQMSYTYYSVTVFFTINLPVLNQFFRFNVTGETSDIYFARDEEGFF